jgi:hypothetical protein
LFASGHFTTISQQREVFYVFITSTLTSRNMQPAIFWTVEEVATRAKKLYADKIRSIVEYEKNICEMVAVDDENGEYAVDIKLGSKTSVL